MMFSMIYNFQSEYKEKAKVLMEGVDRLCYGELNQYEKLYDLSITKEEYLENIKGKTASLFEIATMSGAILCDREDYISSMSIVGRNYGMLFQICDDLLDLYSDNKIGKPMFQDFENGVYTLPVIIAKENNEYLKYLKELANDIKDTGMDSEDKNRLLTILDNAGSKAKVKELANSLYNEGVSIIDSMENKESKAFFTGKYNDLIKEIDKMCK